ncbi:MAG: uroporphyrinogen decarboxylase family protein [Bacillota bacterium]
MDVFSPKERLDRVLCKAGVDRPPVICPGGMLNSALVDVMNQTGHTLPAGHHDAGLMADIAGDVYEMTGFENLGLPFCMTVEAEVLGSDIDYGTLECEPKIAREPYPSVSQVGFKHIGKMAQNRRVGVVVDAVHALSKKYPDIPVIGSVTGPISTAASIVDPMQFLKELRKDPANAHRVVDYVTDHLIDYARLLIGNGATLITIADPTATGEILGPKMFEEYAVRYLNKLADAVHAMGAPVIIHICGKLSSVESYMEQLHANAVSTDALVSLEQLKNNYPALTTMGNVSTFLLQGGESEKIVGRVQRLVAGGVDIIAPACGLSTTTPVGNIQAMTGAVKVGS